MKKILSLIFLLAVCIRFIYFPANIYFGFDQARDAFESLAIYKNFDFKIIGPSTAAENLFHGPLYWYVIGLFYLIGGGNPVIPAAFLLVLNALGIFVIFWIGKLLFDNKGGIIAAFLYAVSFEETQYALYLGNPAPAVITIMLFYGGLALFIFRKLWFGLPLSLFALGLSIQFEFFLIYLAFIFVLIVLFFRNELPKLTKQKIAISAFSLLIPLATFLLADLKFDFRTAKTLLNIFGSIKKLPGGDSALMFYWDKLVLHINDNILNRDLFSDNSSIQVLILVSLALYVFYSFLQKKSGYKQLLFLTIWFLSSILLFAFGIPKLYYSNIGIAPALLLLAGYVVSRIYLKKRALAVLLLTVILVNNLVTVLRNNFDGITSEIYVQEGMLLSREKKALDFMYEKAQGKSFVVSALTMPLKINTTWAYLFNWYGRTRYGYAPVWAGEAAPGYPGYLSPWHEGGSEVIMFNVVEPTRGVRFAFVEQFLAEQEKYGKVTDKKIFGDRWTSQLIVEQRNIRSGVKK